MLVALRMLIARSVSDLEKNLSSMIFDTQFGDCKSIKWGISGSALLAQVDIA